MFRGMLMVILLVGSLPLWGEDLAEVTLEDRLDALHEIFAPLIFRWESLTARGERLNWETGFFEALQGNEIVVFTVPPLEIAEKARRGEALISRPKWNQEQNKGEALPPVYGYPLAEQVEFFTSSGQRISRNALSKLTKNRLVALGRNPETGKVEMVVVLEQPTLQALGEQYGRKIQELTAQE